MGSSFGIRYRCGHYISEDETPCPMSVPTDTDIVIRCQDHSGEAGSRGPFLFFYRSIDDTVVSKKSHSRSEIIRKIVNEYYMTVPCGMPLVTGTGSDVAPSTNIS